MTTPPSTLCNAANAVSAPSDAPGDPDEDQAVTTGELAQEAAAQLFRAVRAGRSWLRSADAGLAQRQAGPCILLKSGNSGPAIFMVPGAPGSVLQLAPLAAELAVPNAVYAIKPRGLEEGETPFETIEEMASFALNELKGVRRDGPYLLVGYSAGGLIALEMAHRLASAGDRVPLVVMLDTYPSQHVWPLRCHVKILGRQCIRAIPEIFRHPPLPAAREVARRMRSLSTYLAACGVKSLPNQPVVREGISPAARRVYLATFNAGQAYRPPRYAGRVVLVHPPPDIPNLWPRAPEDVWRRLLSNFEVHRVEGEHLEMVTSNAAETAALVSPHIRAATMPVPGGPRP